MRFAVIADLHANLAATRAVLADIDALDPAVERIVCAGDIVGHSAHPNEVIALLRQHQVDAVLGNYDEAVLVEQIGTRIDYPTQAAQELDRVAVNWTRQQLTPASREYLRGLPRELRLSTSASGRTTVKVERNDEAIHEFRRSFFTGSLLRSTASRRVRPRRVLLVHGSPRDISEYIYPDTPISILKTIAYAAQADVIIFGHTHLSFQRVVDNTAFIGVGSVGRGRSGKGVAEYAIIEIVGTEIELEFRSVNYDVEAEACAIEARGLPQALADTLRLGLAS
jgi:predicted phosphodiesterase